MELRPAQSKTTRPGRIEADPTVVAADRTGAGDDGGQRQPTVLIAGIADHENPILSDIRDSVEYVGTISPFCKRHVAWSQFTVFHTLDLHRFAIAQEWEHAAASRGETNTRSCIERGTDQWDEFLAAERHKIERTTGMTESSGRHRKR